MEKHSNYFNDNPREAFRRYRNGLKLRCALAMVAVILVGLWIIFGMDEIHLILEMVLYVLILFAYRISTSLHFRRLLDILYQDCDPEKMCEVLTLLQAIDRRGKAKNTLLLYKAQSLLYIPDRREEGLTYLKQVNFPKKRLVNEGTCILLTANYAKLMDDRPGFDLAQADLKCLPSRFQTKGKSEAYYQNLCKLMQLAQLQWDERDDELRALLQELLSRKQTMLNQVVLRMHLARLDLKCGQYQDAKPLLTFVAEHGNRLYHAAEARAELEKLND